METSSTLQIRGSPFVLPQIKMSPRGEDATMEGGFQFNLLSTKIKKEDPTDDADMDTKTTIQAGFQLSYVKKEKLEPKLEPAEPQSLQQQNHIFIFTTLLANESADSVYKGEYPSIIDYHCAQPGTKKYLEERLLKSNSFSPSVPVPWLENLAQAKQRNTFDSSSRMMQNMNQMVTNGTKVPLENLTPQQKQHREEQLATLRKMQQVLLPENHMRSTEFDVLQNAEHVESNTNTGPINTVESSNTKHEISLTNQNYHDSSLNLRKRRYMEVSPGSPLVSSVGDSRDKKMGNDDTSPVPTHWQWPKHQYSFGQVPKENPRLDSSPSENFNRMHGSPLSYQAAGSRNAVTSPNPGSPSNASLNLSWSRTSSPSETNTLFANRRESDLKLNACSILNNSASPVHSQHIVLSPGNLVSPSPLAAQSPAPSMMADSSRSRLDTPNKDLFSRTVTQQDVTSSKEPNLMPVPSPQPIQYVNSFEGQELTIQKQPNTSLTKANTDCSLSQTAVEKISNNPLEQVPGTTNDSCVSSTMSVSPTSQQSQTTVPTTHDTTTVSSSPETFKPSPCQFENLPLDPNSDIYCPPGSDSIAALERMLENLKASNSPPCPVKSPITSTVSSPMHPVGGAGHLQSLDPVGEGTGHGGPTSHANQNLVASFVQPNNPVNSCGGLAMGLQSGNHNASSPKPNMNSPAARPVPPFFGAPAFPGMAGPNVNNGMNVQVKKTRPNTIQYLPPSPSLSSPRPNMSLDFLQRFTNPMDNLNSRNPFTPISHPNSMVGINLGGGVMSNHAPSTLHGRNMVLNHGCVGSLRGHLRPMMPVPSMSGERAAFSPWLRSDPGMFLQGLNFPPISMSPGEIQPFTPSNIQINNITCDSFVDPVVTDANYTQ